MGYGYPSEIWVSTGNNHLLQYHHGYLSIWDTHSSWMSILRVKIGFRTRVRIVGNTDVVQEQLLWAVCGGWLDQYLYDLV